MRLRIPPAIPALFTLLALVWLLLLFAAPVEAAGTTLSAAVYAFGSFICHQQPERSFHLGAAQIPVCARCLGLYAGAAFGSIILPVGRAFTARLANHEGSRNGRLLIAAALPTFATWSLEFAGLWYPSNIIRAAAAVPLGLAIAIVVVAAADRRLR